MPPQTPQKSQENATREALDLLKTLEDALLSVPEDEPIQPHHRRILKKARETLENKPPRLEISINNINKSEIFKMGVPTTLSKELNYFSPV